MPCTWRTADLQLLLTVTVFVAECLSTTSNDTATSHKPSVQQAVNNNSIFASVTTSPVDTKVSSTLPQAEANSSLSVEVDTNVVLFCPPVQSIFTLVTWTILLRDELPCTRAYRTDMNIVEGNCTDPRITWPFRPDQNLALQIEPVSVTHDGNYTCDMATQAGNFLHRYYLQVQVPPAVTLFLTESRTVVCKAAAGKPAAQISWTPGGDCVTEEETLGNGTVTIQSTCHWAERNVSAVSCSVLHLTGNKSLSLELSRGHENKPSTFWVYIISLSVFIFLSTVVSICLLKANFCSKCKLKKREVTPVVGEDEMQPYASYTEKSNPLYDTASRGKTP